MDPSKQLLSILDSVPAAQTQEQINFAEASLDTFVLEHENFFEILFQIYAENPLKHILILAYIGIYIGKLFPSYPSEKREEIIQQIFAIVCPL